MQKYTVKRRAPALALAFIMAAPQALWAQSAIDETPSAAAMAGDLLVARPIGLALTAGGTVAWLVSLPFTLLAGHAGEAAETLVIGPGATTFMRCLGCRNTGYTHKDVDASASNRAAAEARAEAGYD
jgi:hypothetical protein